MTIEEQIINDPNLACYVDKQRGWINEAFMDGVRWADRTVIHKACEWLCMNMTSIEYFGINGNISKPNFIQRFKEAMEGE